jgi:hypothetical protein
VSEKLEERNEKAHKLIEDIYSKNTNTSNERFQERFQDMQRYRQRFPNDPEHVENRPYVLIRGMQNLSARIQVAERRRIEADRVIMIVRLLNNDRGLRDCLTADLITPIADLQGKLVHEYSEKENEIKNILNIP